MISELLQVLLSTCIYVCMHAECASRFQISINSQAHYTYVQAVTLLSIDFIPNRGHLILKCTQHVATPPLSSNKTVQTDKALMHKVGPKPCK